MTDTLKNLIEKIKALLTNPRALGVFAVLYALLLATLYVFISTREATLVQVAVTFVGLVLIPVEFFILQAAIGSHARAGKFTWARIPRDAVRFAVVTIPIIVLGYVLFYYLNKWQVARFPAPKAPITFPPAPPAVAPVHRPTLIFATVRGLIFGVILPLTTIHLWIEVAKDGLRGFLNAAILKRLGRVFARAFSSESVLIYAIGLVIFVAIPYAFLFVPFSVKGNKTEFAVFIARLIFVFVFTLVGWIVTLSTLVTAGAEVSPAASPELAAAEAPA